MTCPACKPDAQCSACLAEELARKQQSHSLEEAGRRFNKLIPPLLPSKRTKGRPRKPESEHLVSLHVSVHPGFLASLPVKGRGAAIEQAFGFTRPTTGHNEKEKA